MHKWRCEILLATPFMRDVVCYEIKIKKEKILKIELDN